MTRRGQTDERASNGGDVNVGEAGLSEGETVTMARRFEDQTGGGDPFGGSNRHLVKTVTDD